MKSASAKKVSAESIFNRGNYTLLNKKAELFLKRDFQIVFKYCAKLYIVL